MAESVCIAAMRRGCNVCCDLVCVIFFFIQFLLSIILYSSAVQ